MASINNYCQKGLLCTKIQLKPDIREIFQLEDGRLILGTMNQVIEVVSVTTFKCLRSFEGHFYSVSALGQLRDGRLLSGSIDKVVKVWDTLSFKCLTSFKTSANVGFFLQLKDNRLALGRYDIEVRDITSFAFIIHIKAHSYNITSIIELEDCRLASACVQDSTTKIWSIPSTQPPKPIQPDIELDYSPLIQLRDGRLVRWYNNHLECLDLTHAYKLGSMDSYPSSPSSPSSLIEFTDGRLLVSNIIQSSLYDVLTFKFVGKVQLDYFFSSCFCLKDGRVLFMIEKNMEKQLQVWLI